MPEGDGVDEIFDGAKRVVLTGAGQVLENMARRREEEARARASSAGAQAAADRQRGEALTAVRDLPTAVAVLGADDRRQLSAEQAVDRDAWAAFDAGEGPEPAGVHPDPQRAVELQVSRAAAAEQARAEWPGRAGAGVPPVEVLIADPESRVRGLGVDKEGTEAAVLAGRSQGKPAAEAVHEGGSPSKGRAPKARGRGRGAERERGR